MAWTTVPTFTSGQILTAAQMNGLGNDLTVLRGDYAAAKRTAGNITLNSNNAWADVNTGLDLTLAAAAGDVIEYSVNAYLANQAVDVFFDVVTVVSGSPVNSFARDAAPANPPTSLGFSGWLCVTGLFQQVTGSVFRTLAAGDISSNSCLLRLRYSGNAAVNRTLYADTALSLYVWARNHGPVEI